MKNYIKNYIKEMDHILEKKEKIDDKLLEYHLIKIKFFQHERLIHLLVTCFYAIFTLTFIGFSFISFLFIPIVVILILFLAFYVVHYFFLENSVQYLYKQYDIMIMKKN